MARIIKRTGTTGEVSYLIRVSCGYDAAKKQITKNMTWHPAEDMTERQMDLKVKKVAYEFEESVISGEVAASTNIKLRDFTKEYMNIVKLAPLTRSYYQRTIDDLINPALGHMKVKAIRPVHVQHFVEILQSPEARKDGKGGTLSASSVLRYFAVLKSIMALAFKLEYTGMNPTVTERLTLPEIDEQEIEIFNAESAAEMLAALDTEPLMWRLLINIAVVTGARRGELCALKWETVDLKKNTISIKGSNYKLKGEETQTKKPKTKKSVRTVSIDNYCVELFRAWRKEQMRQRTELCDQWHEGNWIFTKWNGEPLNPTTPTGWFRDFQERHGIPHHKFHALRHTSGTLLLSSGANIKTVASRLGHVQLSTTNRYLHALEDADRAAAESFGSLRNKEPIPMPTDDKKA